MTPPARWDAVVVGVGSMGSAALYHLARRGLRVLGLERFGVPHDRGSYHGRSRIIRVAYFEDPSYVPLARRAVSLWRELERVSGERLLRVTGSLDAGPEGGRLFEGSRASCVEHGLEHEILDAQELVRRYPAFRWPARTRAVLQPDGGFLHPERCVETFARFAENFGAELRTGVRVTGWRRDGEDLVVTTAGDGSERELRAGRLVLTAGAWTGTLVDLPRDALVPERQVVGWLRPFTPELFAPDRCPVFNVQVPEGHYYGFPDAEGDGFKVGRFHHRGEAVDPDTMEREPGPADAEVVRAFVERYFPEGAGELVSMETCLFTNTPDGHFLVDRHPDDDRVVVAGGFSGHGFKFAPTVGEALADLATEGSTSHDLSLFGWGRL